MKRLITVIIFSAIIALAACSESTDEINYDTDFNETPVANAGPIQNVKTGDTVTLDGSGSVDPDRDRLTYRDVRVSGGWERRKKPANGLPVAASSFLRLEVGYAFARDLEYLDDSLTTSLENGWIGSFSTRF